MRAPGAAQQQKGLSVPPVIIIGALFFIFGFVTWLNSVLIPYLKIACELNNFESYLVAFAFYIAYFVMAIPAAGVLRRSGFKKGMSIGLLVMAAGALVFIPAALTRTYGLFLTGLFILGTGLALLQTAANPYVTIIGPRESAARRISIMGICNKIAGGLAPVILGAIALKDADSLQKKLGTLSLAERAAELDALASRVVVPYCVILAVLLLLSLLVRFSGLPEVNTDHEDEATASSNIDKRSIFQFRHLVLGVAALFLYVGVEVLAGDTIIAYSSWQGIPFQTGKFFTSLTLLAMIAGYIIGIICIPRYLSQEKALRICALLGVIFSAAAIFSHGYASVLFIALLGLANSLMWPAIWPLAIAGLGRFTRLGSSLLIMAIAGGAVLPLLYGRLGDRYNPQHAYWIMVPCYLFIFYYAAAGYKPVKR